jgi:hypothetical protein
MLAHRQDRSPNGEDGDGDEKENKRAARPSGSEFSRHGVECEWLPAGGIFHVGTDKMAEGMSS